MFFPTLFPFLPSKIATGKNMRAWCMNIKLFFILLCWESGREREKMRDREREREREMREWENWKRERERSQTAKETKEVKVSVAKNFGVKKVCQTENYSLSFSLTLWKSRWEWEKRASKTGKPRKSAWERGRKREREWGEKSRWSILIIVVP